MFFLEGATLFSATGLADGAVWTELANLHHVRIELAMKGTEVKLAVR